MNRDVSELAAASLGEPGCVPQWEQSGDSQLRQLLTSCPPAGRGGLAVGTIPLHSRGQMLFMALLSGKESHHSFGECPNAASQ